MSSPKVLLVDDNPINLELLEDLLEDSYETMSAESGEAAQSLALEFKPDVVLLDVMMPGIDGFQTCRWFRSHPELGTTRIIMVSAKASALDIQAGLDAGADDYVTKPYDLADLMQKIGDMLT